MSRDPDHDASRVHFYAEAADSGSMLSAAYNQLVLADFYRGIAGTVERVADIGSGVGSNLGPIRARFPKARVAAFDLSLAGLRTSRRQHGSDAVVADALELPLPGGFADLVVCTEVLEHVADLDRGVAELARITRPGGFCVISSPNYRNPMGFRKASIDRRRGTGYWDPWGGHEGFERLMTPGLVDRAVRRAFEIRQVRGAGFPMAWTALGYRRVGVFNDRHPMLWLGRVPVFRDLAMNRYLLLRRRGT